MSVKIIVATLIGGSLFFSGALAQDSLNVTKVGQLYAYCDYANGVAFSGSYAYVAGGEAGLRIMNVTNPWAPVETGYLYLPG